LEKFCGKKAQLVICDGAPDVTGFHDIDQYIQSQLLVAALNITTFMLDKNGTFIAKIFKGNDVKFLYSQFKIFFKCVDIMKPKSSRSSSVEAFILCRFFDPPSGYNHQHFSAMDPESLAGLSKENLDIAKFVISGDMSSYDE
jgi:tRNA (cytidine32/guanosine34-2'-O)-methyltransferase